jgi:hypothetical protein
MNSVPAASPSSKPRDLPLTNSNETVNDGVPPRKSSFNNKMGILDAQIGEILETRDNLDSSNFDPASYVNQIFPNGN